jgi:hypothetical protein
MRSAIAATLLLISTPAMAVVVTPVHVAPVHVAPVRVAPTVRVNPGVHGHATVKSGTKAHNRTITVVTDTPPAPKKCADSGKDCAKR